MTRGDDRTLGDTFRWVLETALDPAMAAADWLARDIDPACRSAVDLLTCPDVPLAHLDKAKDAFKTMRRLGEPATDRRVAARLYAAAIAAALLHHDHRISRQSDTALRRAFTALVDDDGMPPELRSMVGAALGSMG